MSNKDLEFLVKLDKKLNKIVNRTLTPNIQGNPAHYKARESTDKKLNSEEMKNILKIAKKNYLLLYPIDGNFGFFPNYQISKEKGDKLNILLTFSEEQCPKNYKWDKLSKWFMNGENLKRLNKTNVIIREKDSYYY